MTVASTWWKWTVSLLLPAAVFFMMPELENTSPNTPLFFAITLWAVIA